MSQLTILHLSDLQFGRNPGHGEALRSALLDDILEGLIKGRWKPEVVAVTGDIAHSGSPEEYAKAKGFLDALLQAAQLTREQLIMVPGNHDVNRQRRTPLVRATEAVMLDRDSIESVLGSDSDRRLMFARFEDFYELSDEFGRKDDHRVGEYLPVFHNVKDGRTVGFLCINTAWLSHTSSEEGRLAVGRHQLDSLFSHASGTHVCVALLHHSPAFLVEFDRLYVEKTLADACDLVLHGHVHALDPVRVSRLPGGGVSIGAGALHGTPGVPATYNIIDVNVDTGAASIHTRLFGETRSWVDYMSTEGHARIRSQSDGGSRALHSDVEARRCVAVIGASLTEKAANQTLPSYEELVDLLSEFLPAFGDSEPTRQVTGRDVVDVLAEKYGTQWVRDKVCELVGRAEPGSLHKLLVTLPWSAVITTTYDRLLDRAYQQAGLDPVICSHDTQLHDACTDSASGAPLVIKLFGDCVFRASMAVQPSALDGQKYLVEHPALSAFLREHLPRRSLVFMGYSASDPNLRFLRDLVKAALQDQTQTERHDYLVLPDPSEADMRMWSREKGLVTIPLSSSGPVPSRGRCVQQLLQDIAAHTATEPRNVHLALPGQVLELAEPARTRKPPTRRIRQFANLGDELRALSGTGSPVCGIICSRELVNAWLTFMREVDSTQSVVCLAVAYEDLPEFSQTALESFARDLAGGMVLFLVDFAGAPSTARSLYAAVLRTSVPVLPVGEKEDDIPVRFHAMSPVYYTRRELTGLAPSLQEAIEPLLRSLLLGRDLEGLNEVLEGQRRYDTVVLDAFKALEGALRYLAHKAIPSSGTPSAAITPVTEILRRVEDTASRTGVVIDRKKILSFNTLRNEIAHEGGHAREDQARWALRFTNDFIRYNVGPNLRSFDVAGNRKQDREGR